MSFEYIPYHQWPEYDHAAVAFPKFAHAQNIGTRPKGTRWGIGPLHLEEYIADEEPNISESKKTGKQNFRFIIWKRLHRIDVPHGWWRGSIRGARTISYIALTDQNWSKTWSKTAQSELSRWKNKLENITYTIETCGIDEFLVAYKASSVPSETKKIMSGRLVSLAQTHPNSISLWIVRNIRTGRIAAGFAAQTSRYAKNSYYFIGFLTERATNLPLMTALINHWHEESHRIGIEILDLGYVWQPGNPKTWKGFSKFKYRFHPRILVCPPVLLRIVPGKLF